MTNMHGWTHLPKSLGGTDPIPGLGGSLPMVRAHGNGITAVDGSDYALSWPVTEYFISAEGIADTIAIENDPSNDVFMLGADGGTWIIGGRGLFAFDAGVVIDTVSADTVVTIRPSMTGPWTYPGTESPISGLYEERRTIVAADGPRGVRIAGLAIMDAPAYDVSNTETLAGFSILVYQTSGNDQTISQSWFSLTRLTSLA